MNLGELYLELGLDTAGYYSQLDAARQEAIRVGAAIESSLKRGGFNNLNLNPKVNHANLTALNKHLESKRLHVQKIQREWDRSPLTPKVDLRQLDALEQRLDRIQRRNVRMNIAGSTGSAGSAGSSRSGSSDQALADQIGRAVARHSKNPVNTIGRAAGQAVSTIGSIPFKIAGNALSGVAQGITLSLTNELSKNLGKGLSSALETSVSSSFGSTELLGEKLGGALGQAFVDAAGEGLNDLPKAANKAVQQLGEKLKIPSGITKSIAGEVEKGLQEDLKKLKKNATEAKEVVQGVLGSEDIAREGLFRRGRREQSNRQRMPISQEQATKEWRESIQNLDNAKGTFVSRSYLAKNQFSDLRKQAIEAQKEVKKLQKEIEAVQFGKSKKTPEEVKSLNQDFILALADLGDARSRQKLIGLYRAPETKKKVEARMSQLDEAEKSIKESRDFNENDPETQKVLNQIQSYRTTLEGRLAKVQKAIDLINKPVKQAYDKARQSKGVFDQIAPQQIPTAYQSILDQVTGGQKLRPDQVPRLQVADAQLAKAGAMAEYNAAQNTISLRKELFDAIQKNNLSGTQAYTLSEEVQHAKQAGFGSFEGIMAFKQNRSVNPMLSPQGDLDPEMARDLSQYSPERRPLEYDAKVRAKQTSTAYMRQQTGMNQLQFNADLLSNSQIFYRELDKTSKGLSEVVKIAKEFESIPDDIANSIKGVYKRLDFLRSQMEELESSVLSFQSGDDSEIRKAIETFSGGENLLTSGLGDSKERLAVLKKVTETRLDEWRKVVADRIRGELGDLMKQFNRKKELIPIAKDMGLQDVEKLNKKQLIQRIVGESDLEQLKPRVYDLTRQKAQEQLRRQERRQDFVEGVGFNARRAGNMAQNVINSPAVQGFAKGTQQAAGAMVQVAKVGYSVASGLESVALDLIPMGRTIKAIGQQTAVPAALALGATALLPGGGALAAGATHLMGGAIAPLAHGAAASLTGSASSALAGLPQMFGIQSAVTGVVTGAIESAIGGIASTAAPALAAILGGKAIQTAASLPLKGLQSTSGMQIKGLPGAKQELKQIAGNPELQNQPLQMPLSLPSADKVKEMAAIEVRPNAGMQKSNAQKQSAQQAKQTAQKAGEMARSVVDATQNTIKGAADAVQQAEKIAKGFRDAYASLKDAIDSGDAKKAQALLEVVKNNAEKAKNDISDLIKGLGDQAKFGTSTGSKLSNRKSQISQTVDRFERQVKKMKPADLPTDAIDIAAIRGEDTTAQQLNREQVLGMVKDLTVNAAGFAASHAVGDQGIVASLGADLMGAMAARQAVNTGIAGVQAGKSLINDPTFKAASALEKFTMLLNKASEILQSSEMQSMQGNEIFGDLAGFSVGNLVSQLSGIPGSGGAAAMAIVPQLSKLRESIRSGLTDDVRGEDTTAQQRLDFGRIRGGKGLTEDQIKKLKELDQLLLQIEKHADRFDASFGKVNSSTQKQFEESTKAANEAAEAIGNGIPQIEETKSASKGLAGVLGLVGKGFVAFTAFSFVAPMLGDIANQSLNAAREFENLDRIFTFAYGSMSAGADAMAKVRSEAKSLGLDLRSALQGQAQLAAATRGTNMEGFTTESLASATRQATAVMGLDPQQAERVQLAIQQMASKGKISSEELRQQLGESLPGAFQIAARAIGVTTSELSNMLDRGEVLSEDFLPKFAAQLSAESQAGLAGAANTAQASINRFNNSVLELQASLGAPLLPVQKLGLNALAEALNVVKAIMPVVTVAVGALGIAIVQTTVSMISGTAVAGVFAAGLTALKSVLSATIALMSTPQFAIVVAIAAAAAAFMKFKEVYLDVGQQQRDFADQTIKGMQGYKNSIIEARMELEKLGKIAPSDLNNLNPENNRRSFESRLKEAQSKPFFEKTAEDLNTELTGAIQSAQRDRQSAANQQAIQAGIGLGNAETSPRETLLTLLGSYRGVAGFTGGTNQDSTIGQLLAQQKQLEGLQIQRRSLLPGESGRRTALDREIQSIQESMAPLQQVVAGAQSQAQSQIQFFEQQRKLNQDQGNTAEADKFAAARDEVQTLFEELSKYIQPVIDRLGDLNRDLADVQGGFEKLNMEIDRQTNSQKRSIAQSRIAGGLTPGEIQAASAQVDIANLNSRIANNQSSIAQRSSRLQNDAYLQELLNPILQRYGATSYEQLTPSQINEQAASMTGEGQQNDRQLLERFSSEFERTTQMQQETDQLLTQVAEARAAAIEQIRSTTNQIYEFFRGIENQSKELELSTQRTANQAKTTLAQNKLKSALIGFQDSFLNEFVDSLVQMVEALNKPLDEALNAQQQILQAQQQYFSSIQQAYSLNQQLPTEVQAAGLMGNGGIMPGMQSGMPGQAGMMPGVMPGQAGTGGLVAGTTDNTSSFMGINVANPQPITSAGVIANQTAGFSPLALLSEQDLQGVRQQLLQQGLIQPAQGGMQAGAMPDGLPGLSVPLDDPRAYQRQQEGLRSFDPVQSVQAGNTGIQQAAGQAYQNYQQQVQSIQTQLSAAQDSAQLEARASMDRADRALFDAGRRMSETGRNFQRSIEDLASQGQQQTPFVQLQTQLRGLNNQFEDSMQGMEDFRRGLQQTIDQSGMLRDFITEGLAAGTLPEQFRDMLPGLDAAAAQAQQQLEGLRQMQDEYNQAFLQAAKKAQADFDRQQKQSQAQIQANIRQMDNDLAQARSQQSQLMGNNDRSRVFDAQSKGAALGEEYYQQIQNLEQLRYEGKLGAEQFEEMVGKLRELNDIKLDNLQQEIQNLADSGLIDALSKIPVGDSNAGQMNSSDRRQQQAQVNRTRQQAQRAFDEGYISRDQLDRTLSAASAVGGALNNTNASVFTFADVARQNQGNPLVQQLLGSIGQGDALALADLASPQSVQASMAAAEQANQAGIAAGDQYAGISSPVTNAVNQLGDRISAQLTAIEQALKGASLRPNLSVTSKDPVGDAGKIYADLASKTANL